MFASTEASGRNFGINKREVNAVFRK